MKVEEVTNQGLKHEYKVTVDAAEIKKTVDAKLKNISGRVKIPGFRPGHIPMNILQQRYGKSVLGEAVEQSVQDATRNLVRDKQLKPALQPKLEITEYKDGGDLEFKVTVENLPDVPQKDFSAIELERLAFEVEDTEIDAALGRISDANKSFESRGVDATAEKGDVVVIDFTGKKDGVPFEGGASKNFRLTLGSGQFIPGFEDQLIGVKAGDERTLELAFPKEYHKQELAGQPVTFDVIVHDVQAGKAPAQDENFAKQLGFDAMDKVRDAVRDQLTKEYGNVQRQKLKKQLFDYLENNYDFEVPQGMLDLEFDSIWQRLQEAKQQGDPSLDKPEDELKAEYQKIAARRVRLGLILADVGQKQQLSATKDELTRAVMEQARQFPGQEKKVFEFYQQNPSQVDELRGPILEDKAVDYILAQAKLKDRKVPLSELLSEEDESSGQQQEPAKAKKKA